MELALRNIPSFLQPDKIVVVLAVSANPGLHACLRGIFSRSNWRMCEVSNCREALEFLTKNPIGVVICDSDAPDDTWKSLLVSMEKLPSSPLLIVASSDADDGLWAEALNLGAYDILARPLERVEVIRIVSLAWLQWRDERRRAGRKPAMSVQDERLSVVAAVPDGSALRKCY